jgi:tetratricopeptide (TPR) repeat protein
MVVSLSLKNPIARIAALLAAAAVAALLVALVLFNFIIGTMVDYRKRFNRDELASPVYHFPGSARMHARLAEAEMMERNRDLANAEYHALAATRLSPYDYRNPLILASIKEAGGDRQAAEEQLRKALALAPTNISVRYQLANLLVREGRVEESIEEFRAATAADPRLLAGAIDLIWQVSNKDVGVIERVAGETPKAQMTLAQFLLKQSRAEDAARVFVGIDRKARLTSVETPSILKSFIEAGYPGLARYLWVGLASNNAETETPIVWNGGFETDLLKNFSHFDWAVPEWAVSKINNRETRYARLGVDRTTAHTGARSLKVEFAGENTTRLDGEVKQLIALKPGARYRLECYVKTEGLITPEGPRVVVVGGQSEGEPSKEPASEAVRAGSNDWQRLTIDFIAPQSKVAGQSSVQIAIKRIPQFSYDEPTRGTVWFDDFKVEELRIKN